MAYKYEWNNQALGDFHWTAEPYRLMQAGLKELLEAVERWNRVATDKGWKVPYQQEAERLRRMIEYGEDLLAQNQHFVYLHGVSVGSASYLRAGLDLMILRQRRDLATHRAEGLPGGVLRSLEAKIRELEDVAEQLDVEPAAILWEILLAKEASVMVQQVRGETVGDYDVFVSHATEDQEGFVRLLAEGLVANGLKVWYSEFSLTIGDSLRRSIDHGLSASRFGIVVLSPSFFAKEWPQRELDGLAAREHSGQKVILPVWHDISIEGVRAKSPTLADRVAISSDKGIDMVVQELLKVIRPGR